MTIVELCGGLGNQMFQHAFARSLAIKRSDSLYYDLSWYVQKINETTPREFTLHKFPIHVPILSPARRIMFNQQHSWKSLIKSKIRGDIICVRVDESDLDWKVSAEREGNIYITGYWQNAHFFESIRATIEKDFLFNAFIDEESRRLSETILSTESVSIHVRRGDYANNIKTNVYHGLCSREYYERAVSIMTNQIAFPYFFVFSDDPDWVRFNFSFLKNYTLVSDFLKQSDMGELHLMTLCKHAILANSSFSWWGAWLGRKKEITIAPRNWYAERNELEIYCNNWLKI